MGKNLAQEKGRRKNWIRKGKVTYSCFEANKVGGVV